jgi:hypothetical protein
MGFKAPHRMYAADLVPLRSGYNIGAVAPGTLALGRIITHVSTDILVSDLRYSLLRTSTTVKPCCRTSCTRLVSD